MFGTHDYTYTSFFSCCKCSVIISPYNSSFIFVCFYIMSYILTTLLVSVFASLISEMIIMVLWKYRKQHLENKLWRRIYKLLEIISLPIKWIYLTIRYWVSYWFNKKLKATHILKISHNDEWWWREIETLSTERVDYSWIPFDTEIEALSNAQQINSFKILSTPRKSPPVIHYIKLKSE